MRITLHGHVRYANDSRVLLSVLFIIIIIIIETILIYTIFTRKLLYFRRV